jgi:prepilin-type N-terminal cleavage/methylation domain-containing protein
MLYTILKKLKQHQAGFTLIELLIGITVAGFLTTGIGVSISQITSVNSSNTARMQAIKQVELAIDCIRLDVQMAQEIYTSDPDPVPDPDVFLALKWKEWDNTSQSIKYSWDSTTKQLRRSPSKAALNAVAINIDSKPIVQLPNSNYISIRISATVGDNKPATETRVFEVRRRY